MSGETDMMTHKPQARKRRNMRIGIVTGASSGMGREFVRQIDQAYAWLDEIWVIARREQGLEALRGEMKNLKLRILPLDITRQEHRERLEALLKEQRPLVKILVNAAGTGIQRKLESLSGEEAVSMTELNCTALTAVTRMCLPYCRNHTRIFCLASGAAFLPQPGFGVYAATKAYVLSFSRALHREVRPLGITVTAVCPGPVDTPFLEKMGGREHMPGYKKIFIAKPEKVVRKALKDGARGRELSLYGLAMKALGAATGQKIQSLLLKIVEEKTKA